MSQENVEAFNRAFEAGTCFDAEALLEELHPQEPLPVFDSSRYRRLEVSLPS
jgi:hypothetical protein